MNKSPNKQHGLIVWNTCFFFRQIQLKISGVSLPITDQMFLLLVQGDRMVHIQHSKTRHVSMNPNSTVGVGKLLFISAQLIYNVSVCKEVIPVICFVSESFTNFFSRIYLHNMVSHLQIFQGCPYTERLSSTSCGTRQNSASVRCPRFCTKPDLVILGAIRPNLIN